MSPAKTPFETKDTSFGPIVVLIGLLFILIGGTLLVTRILNHILNQSLELRNPPASAMAQPHQLPPEPRLQANPTVDLIRLRDVENVALNNYAWIDPDKNIARIPITRAMAILADRGLPARSEKPQ